MPHPAWGDAVEAVERAAEWAAAGNRVAAPKALWPTSKRGWVHSNENNPEQAPKSQKIKNMKIAFTASGDSLDAPLDSRFGRASRFLIYDDTTGRLEALDNEQNLNAAQGAGIQAAVHIVKQEVDCVITGHCGPKAFQVLESAGIKVYPCSAETIADAYQLFKDGSLVVTESATVEGHW